MDFNAMKRKELQSLCKKHGISANLRNTEMADRLTLLLKENEQPIEPECKKLQESERAIDSDVEIKKVKRVKFSPENQTHYFVGTDVKKKVGTKRKSMATGGVSKQKFLENSSEVKLLVEMTGSPGIVTRSRRQTMVKGDAQAIFSSLAANKRKVKAGVKKVDVCDKSQREEELSGRADGHSEGGQSSRGLTQIHLRSRVVAREEKNQMPRKTKENKATDGVLLPSEIDEVNVPARAASKPEKMKKQGKGSVTKVEDSSVLSEKSRKIDLGGRITLSRTQVEEKNSGGETEEGILEVRETCADSLQLEQTFKGPDRKYFRRKSVALPKKSVHDEELAADPNEPAKTLRRSNRNLARERVSVCGPLAETKVAGKSKKAKSVFVGEASGGKECLEVPKLQEPSKSTRITTSRRKVLVVHNGEERETVGTRKRPRHTDSGKASNLEQCVETIGQCVVLPPNAPLSRSRRRTTLLSSAALGDTKPRICDATAMMNESTESVSRKAKPRFQSIQDICGKVVIKAKKDRFSKQVPLEKESSYIVNDSLNKRPERRSSRNVSKLDLVAPTRSAGIVDGKNKKGESRTSVIAREVSCAKVNSPLKEEPNLDVLDVRDTSGNENYIDSCSIKDGVGRPSKKRTGLSQKSESLNIGDTAVDVDDYCRLSLNKATIGHDNILDQNQVECPDKLSDVLSPGIDQSPMSQPNSKGESPNLLDSEEAVEADESLTIKMTDQKSSIVDDQLADGNKACIPAVQNLVESDTNWIDPSVLTEALENKESDETTEGSAEIVEEINARSPCDRKEIVQVDSSCPSLNTGDTGHAAEQKPVECSAKLSSAVSSKCTCFVDGHLDCDAVDDQLEYFTKATVPLDQNFQLGASGVDQPFLVESLQNMKSDETTHRSSNIIDGTSDLGTKKIVRVDVGSSETAEIIADTVGEIHQGGTVPSDTAVTVLKYPKVKQDWNHFQAQSTIAGEQEILCGRERNKGPMPEENDSFIAVDLLPIVIAEAVSEGCERKMDNDLLKKTEYQEDEMLITEVAPVFKSSEKNEKSKTEVDSVCKESDRNTEVSSQVAEEKSALCPCDTKEMVQVDVASIGTVETSAGTIEEIHEGGTPPKSSIRNQDEKKFEAPSTIVRESNINHIGMIDSCRCESDICDEVTSSWTAEILSHHERSEVVEPDENESGNLPYTVEIVNKEVASESTERNSRLDGDVLKKTDAQIAEDKIQKVLHKSIGSASAGIKEKHVNEDAVEDIQRSFSFELPRVISNEGEQFKLPVNGDPDMHKEDSSKHMKIYSHHESSMNAMVDETMSGSLFVLDVAKLQDGNLDNSQGPSNMVMPVDREVVQSVLQLDQVKYGDPDKPKEVSLEMKRHASVALDDCIYRDDDNAHMGDNVGKIECGINSKSEMENDCLVESEMVDLSSCCPVNMSSNAVESNMLQIEAGLAGTDGIVDTDSIREVELSADNSCAKPVVGPGDLNGSIEGEKNNREEEKTNSDGGNGILDVSAPFQEVEVAMENKVQACSVDGVYLNTMNGSNVDKSATSRENVEGVSDVQKENPGLDLWIESQIFTDWEMSTIFEDAELVEEPPIFEDNKRYNEQDTASAAIQEYIDYENDGCRNSGVAEGSAPTMTGDRVEMQWRENRESSLQFSSEFLRMVYSDRCKHNLPADEGASVKVENHRSIEVAEAPLGEFDEGFGMHKVVSSKRGKCVSAASCDSKSRDGKTPERIANVKKMDEESSSRDTDFDQLAETECPDGNNNSFDNALLDCGHKKNNIASDEVLTKCMGDINDIEKIDDGTKLAEEMQLVLDGGNLLDERKYSDVNLVSGISSSWAELGPSDVTLPEHNVSLTCTDPERSGLSMHECDKFAMVERVSGRKVDDGRKAERSVDYPANSPVTASSHESEDFKLNVASPVLNSFGIKHLFSDDKIYELGTSNREVSNVNSSSQESKEIKNREESAVVIPQVASGHLTDRENKLEEMGIHCPGDSSIANFSTRGDSKSGEAWNQDAVLISEDVKEGMEDGQDFVEQHTDHGQRMTVELPKSIHLSVSDEYTCVNERSNEKGIRPINHEFVDREDIDEPGNLENSHRCIGREKLIDDAKLSGHSYSKPDGNNEIPDVEETKFPVESVTVSELNVTAVQSPTSANSALRKENLELSRKKIWEEDSDKNIIVSSAPRWENKKCCLIPKTPKTVSNTFDMKENFRSAKSNQVSKIAVKSLQTKRALEDLQKN